MFLNPVTDLSILKMRDLKRGRIIICTRIVSPAAIVIKNAPPAVVIEVMNLRLDVVLRIHPIVRDITVLTLRATVVTF